MIISKLINIIL